MVESFERRLDARLVASIVAAGSLSFCAVLLFLAGTLLSHSGTGPFWLTIRRLFAHGTADKKLDAGRRRDGGPRMHDRETV
ncbi:hypothetical protein, partial [Enorma massiliensis]|uniref:hypothetical protein n=1 Tax=Enorma massiliensis TaxID=1472761 RepID=UPI0034A43830